MSPYLQRISFLYSAEEYKDTIRDKYERGAKLIIGQIRASYDIEESDNLSVVHVDNHPYVVPRGYVAEGDTVYIIETHPRCIRGTYSYGIVCKTVEEAKDQLLIRKRIIMPDGGAFDKPVSPTPSRGGVIYSPSTDVVTFADKAISIQADMLRKYVKTPAYVIMDLVGSSVAYSFANDMLSVASSKHVFKPDYNNLYWRIAIDSGIEDVLRIFCQKANTAGVTLIGKVIGPDIKGNRHGMQKYDFFASTLVDHDSNAPFSFGYMMTTLMSFGIKSYPLMEKDHLIMRTPQDYYAKYKNIKSPIYSGADGDISSIIVRPHMEVWDFSYGRISFRVPVKHREGE